MTYSQHLKKIINDVYANEINPDKACRLLKDLPYKDLDFARIDHHRSLRKGFGEVVFCEGKKPDHLLKIVQDILKRDDYILCTRANKAMYKYLKKKIPALKYSEGARIIYSKKLKPKNNKSVLIFTAGTSDIPVAEEAKVTLEVMGNNVKAIYDVGVAGLHRLLDKLDEISRASVIIVVAGMEGALASVVSGLTDRPVIAVPTSVGYGANFKGLAPLLTMMNCCAPGVSVVNIDNGFGAGYFASLINNSHIQRSETKKCSYD